MSDATKQALQELDDVLWSALGLATVPAKAFAFALAWEWHMVRLGAPPIGAASAFGLLCLAGIVRPRTIRDTSHEPAVTSAQAVGITRRRVLFVWASLALLLAGAWAAAKIRGDA